MFYYITFTLRIYHGKTSNSGHRITLLLHYFYTTFGKTKKHGVLKIELLDFFEIQDLRVFDLDI